MTSSYSVGTGYARDIEFDRLDRQAALTFPRELQSIRAFGLTTDGVVVDFGSGNGAVTERLRAELPDAVVYGADNDLSLLATVPPPTLAVQDGRIPLPDNAADDVLMRFVAQHLTPRQRMDVFAELWRVLRPGGRIHVIDVDDSDVGRSSGMVTRGLVEIFGELQRIQGENGGDRLVVKKIPAELDNAGFEEITPVAATVTTEDHPVSAFSVHMGPDRYIPLVSAGVLSVEQLAVVGWSWERLRRDPNAFISINVHSVHARKPNAAV